MRYISASAMHSDKKHCKMEKMKLIPAKWLFIKFLLLSTIYLLVPCVVFTGLLSTFSYAEVLDRAVAIVDEEVVMRSEFNEAFQWALNMGVDVTHENVLDGLINRILLLKEAKKFHKENVFAARIREDKNVLVNVIINEYIEKRLKIFIRIPFEDVERFYEKNKGFFEGDFYDVRDKIESYLAEIELNKKLARHIEELREKAYIRIQLKGGNK